MEAKLINPFINSTLAVLKTMAQIEAIPGKPSIKKGNFTWGEVTGIIGMAGDSVTGNLIVSFDSPSILHIVEKLLFEKHTVINADVIDAVGEITNMISGGTKSELSELGYSFNMATPMIVTGKNIGITQLSKDPVITIPFKTPEGEFVLEANLSKTK